MGYLSKVTSIMKESEEGAEDGLPKDDINILLVEDEELVADTYQDWLLNEGYSVEVVYGGREALKTIGEDTDVVLLDRRMPLITGDEVLDVLRSDDIDEIDLSTVEDGIPEDEEEDDWDMDIDLETVRKLDAEAVGNLQSKDIDCNICMVTAVDPDLDIVDMDFDHYVTKNVSREELLSIVEGLISLEGLETDIQEYQALNWKKQMLEETKAEAELQESEEYQRIKEAMARIEERSDDVEELKEIAS